MFIGACVSVGLICHNGNMMAGIDFADLQALSGYKQVSKVVDWSKPDKIRDRRGRKPARLTTCWSKISMAIVQGSLPPYVLADKYGYRLKPYRLCPRQDKVGKTINLVPPDAPMSEVWRAYEEAIGDDRQTVGWLLDLYKDSDSLGSYLPSLRRNMPAPSRVTGAPVGNDRFGSVRLDQVDKRSIRSYLDTYPSPVAEPPHSCAEVGTIALSATRYLTTRV